MTAQMFGLVALPTDRDPMRTVCTMIDKVERAEQESKGRFKIVHSARALRHARDHGARSGLLSIEGVHALRGQIARAGQLIDRGVVSFGLAHFHANEACSPAYGYGRDDNAGLTAFGRDLVNYLGQRGALVDLTHINRRGFFDAVAEAKGPVFVSHTGVASAFAHWRNLDDEQIRAIADKGGVIGLIFAKHFVGGNTIDDVVRHIKHVIDVGGEHVAALGSDFDGMIIPVKGLRDITGLPLLAEAMRRSGLSTGTVDRVMGGNAFNLLDRITIRA